MSVVAAPPQRFRCTVVGDHLAGAEPVTFTVGAGRKVLHEMALHEMTRSGRMPLVVGCRGGGCGACRVHVLEGTYEALRMSARHVSPDDLANGVVLACRIVPTSDLVVEPAPSPLAGT
jgi:ferredoxin